MFMDTGTGNDLHCAGGHGWWGDGRGKTAGAAAGGQGVRGAGGGGAGAGPQPGASAGGGGGSSWGKYLSHENEMARLAKLYFSYICGSGSALWKPSWIRIRIRMRIWFQEVKNRRICAKKVSETRRRKKNWLEDVFHQIKLLENYKTYLIFTS